MIAKGIAVVSSIGFQNCASCIAGLLIWTQKPSKEEADKANVGRRNFFCGRKNKFGLNFHAVSGI